MLFVVWQETLDDVLLHDLKYVTLKKNSVFRFEIFAFYLVNYDVEK